MRATLAEEARAREIAAEAAAKSGASASMRIAVGRHVAVDSQARVFLEHWGTLDAKGL